MLGDDVFRPSEYGRSKEKLIHPALSHPALSYVRRDIAVSDYEVEEYTNLTEIFREIRDDDHADEFTEDNNWQATDKDHRNVKPYEDSENLHVNMDYIPLDEEEEDTEIGSL